MIFVVGYQGRQDVSWTKATNLLRQAGFEDMLREMLCAFNVWPADTTKVRFFDMTTMPERGDVLNSLGERPDMVVALNLCGFRGQAQSSALDHHYNKNNVNLYKICKEQRSWLLTVGHHPTLPKDAPVSAVLVMFSEDGESDLEYWVEDCLGG